MKNFIAISLFFLGLSVNGQSLLNLDKDYGIGKIKLESPYSLYKNDSKNFNSDNQGLECLSYNKLDIKEVFGIPVKEISLCFINDKLYSISINFGALTQNQNFTLIENIKSKYDMPYITQPKFESRVYVAAWVTDKAYLQVTEYGCSSTLHSGSRCETVLFLSYRKTNKYLPTK